MLRRAVGTALRVLRLQARDGFVGSPLLHQVNRLIAAPLHRAVLNPVNRIRYGRRATRRLEIGPGATTIAGFESLNVVSGLDVTYVGTATRLPFPDCTFDTVYASHILEHIPWYHAPQAVGEWVRVLKRDGSLEVWTPDALKIARAFVAAEERAAPEFENDGWWRFNVDHDPCVWFSGRSFSYGDGSGRDHPNWHRSAYSPRYLVALLERAGLTDVRLMDRSEVRGADHGWINLGVTGRKRGAGT